MQEKLEKIVSTQWIASFLLFLSVLPAWKNQYYIQLPLPKSELSSLVVAMYQAIGIFLLHYWVTGHQLSSSLSNSALQC